MYMVKNVLFYCAVESLYILFFIFRGNVVRKWYLYRIWESDKWVEGSKKKKKNEYFDEEIS